MAPPFDPNTLAALDTTPEIRLETTSLDGERSHRTIIWVVTVGDQVFVRSVRGAAGRWYREVRQRPESILQIGGARIPVTAEPATDAATVQQVSDAFETKYGRRSAASTASMLEAHTLETTLRLEPTGGESTAR